MASTRIASFQALAIFAVLIVFSLVQAEVTKSWVVYDAKSQTFAVSSTEQADYVAFASFENTINKTGWSKLDVQTRAGPNREYSDSMQAYAAGFVEGHITKSVMAMHWANTGAWVCPEPLTSQCTQVMRYLQQNLAWMLDVIKTQASTVPYWYHVELFLEQTAGLQDGYSGMDGKLNTNIDVLGVYMWQVGGDMETLLNLFAASEGERVAHTPKGGHAPDPWGVGVGHCSALLRLLPDLSDLYVAQDTWSDFSSMLRTLKRYSFEYLVYPQDNSTLMAGRTMTFSSYPGVLMSGDDFYAISSGMIAQETTIGYSNSSLNKYIKPTSVPEGIRSMVANRLASSGRDWANIFSMTNSGTYNNAWMIVDYKLFTPGNKQPVPGLFTYLEQIPGTILYKDLTQLLYSQTYFGSYNIPYFPEIFNKSGQPALVAKFGDWFTYDKSPRALIYKRDVPNVKDLTSMTKLMRYNNFKHDPLSRCKCNPPYSAENAIAARDDLNPANGTYPFSALGFRPHTATDMKLISSGLMKSLSFLAQSSPPFDDLPAFQWSTSPYSHLSHVGHPDVWKFPVVTFNGADPMA